MRQPTAKLDLKRAGLTAILTLGMAFGPVPTIAFAGEAGSGQLGSQGEGQLEGQNQIQGENQNENSNDPNGQNQNQNLEGGLEGNGGENQNPEDGPDENSEEVLSKGGGMRSLALTAQDDTELTSVYWLYDKDHTTLYLSKDASQHDDYKEWDDQDPIPWEDVKASITKVVIESDIVPESMSDWFNGCAKLTTISGLDKIDTSLCVDMSGLFSGCKALTELDVSTFVVGDGTLTDGMFNGCTALKRVKLGKKFRFNRAQLPIAMGDTKWVYEKNPVQKNRLTEKELSVQWDSEEEDKRLAGWWKLVDTSATVKVTLNANGGKSGDKTSVEVSWGTRITDDYGYTYENHSFEGWSSEKDGSGTSYAIPEDGKSEMTMYAQWEAESTEATLVFDPNGATDMKSVSKETKKDTEYTLPSMSDLSWKYDGHELTGWNTMSDGKGTTYKVGDKYKVLGGATLYAVWDVKIETDATGTPEIKWNNKDTADVVDGIVTTAKITDEDKAKGVKIWLETKVLEGDALKAVATDVAALAAKAASDSATEGTYFDLSLYKKIGDGEATKITDKLPKALEFTITVPDALKNTDSKKTRTFYLYRYHNGVATEVTHGTTMTLKGSSDQFSTYLIAYKDSGSSSSSSSSSSKSSGNTTTTTTTRTSTSRTTPATGDNTSFLPVAAAGAAGIAAIGFGIFRKRKN